MQYNIRERTKSDLCCRARERFVGVVQPLIEGLRAYTGFHITLLAGRLVDGQFDIRSMHVGTTKSKPGEEGLDFTDWDKEGYKQHVLDQFMRYLTAAGGFGDRI